MGDTNEIRFSGILERLRSVTTKSGVSMATLLLKVGQDRFKVVAFKNVADAILELTDGDQLAVAGSGSINSWKGEDGAWNNVFQTTAWKCEINGQVIEYEKNAGNGSQTTNSMDDGPPLPPEPDERDPGAAYQHRGGPF